jgi:hypothetical protein
MDGSATYMAVATPDYSASVRGPLVARRHVDAVAVDVALSQIFLHSGVTWMKELPGQT